MSPPYSSSFGGAFTTVYSSCSSFLHYSRLPSSGFGILSTTVYLISVPSSLSLSNFSRPSSSRFGILSTTVYSISVPSPTFSSSCSQPSSSRFCGVSVTVYSFPVASTLAAFVSEIGLFRSRRFSLALVEPLQPFTRLLSNFSRPPASRFDGQSTQCLYRHVRPSLIVLHRLRLVL